MLEELQSTDFDDHPEPPPGRVGPKKGRWEKSEKKPGSGGAALEYVRKLRKMEEQATAPVFPLGTNLQVKKWKMLEFLLMVAIFRTGSWLLPLT